MLVVGGLEGLAVVMRRSRRKRGKARRALETDTPSVPVTRLTVIRPGTLGDHDAAETWLRGLEASPESADELVAGGVRVVNRALHAHRLATQDPYAGGVSPALALATRVGYGTGDELADGRFTDAVELPPAPGPRSRADALRPQERLAATLGRRETTDACETLILRARADLDGGRMREAALQLRVGLEALLSEVQSGPVPKGGGQVGAIATQHAERQIEDLSALGERRALTGAAANEALGGELSAQRADEVTATVELCERVLRRRRMLAQ